MIAHCELFHETSMCECLCVSRREICPCRTKKGLFLNFREFIISRSLDYIFNAVVQVEIGQKVIVVVVGILPMINTKGFASPLLYACSTCSGPLTSVNLVLIYTSLSSHIKRSYMPASRTE